MSAIFRGLPWGSTTVRADSDEPGLPPPVYSVPFESTARSHKYAVEGSAISRNWGASERRPLLRNERPLRLPFSKSVRSLWTQLFVSTADRNGAPRSAASKRNCTLILPDRDPDRLASADHVFK